MTNYIVTVKVVSDEDANTIKNAVSNGLSYLMDISQEVTCQLIEQRQPTSIQPTRMQYTNVPRAIEQILAEQFGPHTYIVIQTDHTEYVEATDMRIGEDENRHKVLVIDIR
jgi:hypothetical protein